ncbi:unnamed protein product, partial [Cuscuta europaea]
MMNMQHDDAQRYEVRGKGVKDSERLSLTMRRRTRSMMQSKSDDHAEKSQNDDEQSKTKNTMSDSDEAFESPPKSLKNVGGAVKHQRKEQHKKGDYEEIKEESTSLYNRSSPNVIVNAISKFNDKQREEVINIGFGAMLQLHIQDLPLRLGYGIVDNFDPRSCTLKLNGDKLHVTYKDVENALGFPQGEEIVVKKLKKEKSALADEWRALSGAKEKITPTKVA